MTLDIKAMVIVVLYAVATNIILISIGNSLGSVSCKDFSQENYTYSYTNGNYTNDEDTKTSGINILKLMLGRCNGIPWWAYWLTQIPTIIGVFYIVRAFIGFT